MKRDELLKRLSYSEELISFNCAEPELMCSECLFCISLDKPCLTSLSDNKYANTTKFYNYLVNHIKKSNKNRIFTTKSIQFYINKFNNLQK